jgi:2'-5' RNA ligase
MTEQYHDEEAKDRTESAQLRNHWTRPLGPLGYYWFLTFENSPELAALVNECQPSIDFPYYDLTPQSKLHLTLGKIAHHVEISRHQLHEVAEFAARTCNGIAPFEVSIKRLSGVRSAVAFEVHPTTKVEELRNRLKSATESIIPRKAHLDSHPHPPHITIAYSNADGVSAERSMRAISRINMSIHRISLRIDRASLVLLSREQNHYSWKMISQVPLNGMERI